MMPEKYPEIQGGGSLILAWQVKNKHVLVVGGGEVSILEPRQRWMKHCLTSRLGGSRQDSQCAQC